MTRCRSWEATMTKARLLTMLVGGLAMLAAAAPGQAEVRSVEREGFVIHISTDVAAAPDAVFGALTRPADWWDSEHSWSGDARNMQMDPRVGGCWCETLPADGGVEHGRIVRFDPTSRSIIMDSLLGPLLTTGQTGRLHWRVEGAGPDRSRMIWTYQVTMLPSGNPAQDAVLAAAVDGVLSQQFARLVARVTGAPMPVPPS
jgi:hypothetical protein